ncbi:hypothetical protein BLGI_2580 [Brevibacillus laterosporus GI-9]|nr:hypothetical protein BLGI_2580 [Brevibacillus laterosporus GI-9]
MPSHLKELATPFLLLVQIANHLEIHSTVYDYQQTTEQSVRDHVQ